MLDYLGRLFTTPQAQMSFGQIMALSFVLIVLVIIFVELGSAFLRWLERQ